MDNLHPMYYRFEERCDRKVEFEDWESKFTPGDSESSGLYETLEQCCIDEFPYGIDNCLGSSPREMTFEFGIDISQLIEPSNCQDADIIANAIAFAVNNELGSESNAFVSAIGCVTISRNTDTGNTECGGCLEGSSFIGDYDGTRLPLANATGVVTRVGGEVSTASSECADSNCFTDLLNSVVSMFSSSVSEGRLTRAILSRASLRVPPVGQLLNVTVLTNSFKYEDATNPFVVTKDSTAGLEVTSGGSFEVSFDFSTITSPAQFQVVASYFTDAIQSLLEADEKVPDGASVLVTSICGIPVENFVSNVQCSQTSSSNTSRLLQQSISSVEYDITVYLSPGADALGVTDLMTDVLSNSTSLQIMTSIIITDASADPAAYSIVAALQSMTILSNTAAAVVVRSLAPYYPDWVDTKTCVNNGRQPSFMRDTPDSYLFDTAEECCKQFFQSDDSCGKPLSSSSSLKFFPDFQAGECGRKSLSEFETKLFVYDTLHECCESRFPSSVVECCQSDGLGGCIGSGVFKYLPQWLDHKCIAKDTIFISEWEDTTATSSMQECCDKSFYWDPEMCCGKSGGC